MRSFRCIDLTPAVGLKTRFDALRPGNQHVDAVHLAPDLGSAVVGQENLKDVRRWLGERAGGVCHVGCLAKSPEDNHAPSPKNGKVAQSRRETVKPGLERHDRTSRVGHSLKTSSRLGSFNPRSSGSKIRARLASKAFKLGDRYKNPVEHAEQSGRDEPTDDDTRPIPTPPALRRWPRVESDRAIAPLPTAARPTSTAGFAQP